MTRKRSNALQTGSIIEVDGLPVGDLLHFDRRIVYYPTPRNNTFLAAYIGNKRAGHPMKGWKMHISAFPYNARLVANKILPVLCEMEIWHKYVSSPMLLSKMIDGQRGKFITVYTRDNNAHAIGDETRSVVSALSRLNMLDISGPEVKDEKKLASMVYTRFSEDYTRPGY